MKLHVSALRFFFVKTLKRRYLLDDIPYPLRWPTSFANPGPASSRLIAPGSPRSTGGCFAPSHTAGRQRCVGISIGVPPAGIAPSRSTRVAIGIA